MMSSIKHSTEYSHMPYTYPKKYVTDNVVATFSQLSVAAVTLPNVTWNSAAKGDDALDDGRHVVDELLPPLSRVGVVQTRLDNLHVPALDAQLHTHSTHSSGHNSRFLIWVFIVFVIVAFFVECLQDAMILCASDTHIKKYLLTYLLTYLLNGGWFGVVLTAFVTSTKLRYAEPG